MGICIGWGYILHISLGMNIFPDGYSLSDQVDLDSVLQKWQIDRNQFVDACMLAGTECPTLGTIGQE